MKKLLSITLTAALSVAMCLSAVGICANAESTGLTQGCKSAYLIDAGTGKCIYSENETQRLPIASVCKIMTLTLCFEAIEDGKLNFDDKITVSERASGMGGSQVYLDCGLTYELSELIKSIIVCSANDSCVAVSECVSGSEEQFVALMNKRAEELGCTETLFANCTGLPKDTQYSCAKDVAIMLRNLIKHESYFNYSKIWLEDFVHPDNRTTTITNTNKLIKKNPYCDGGKTGFTNEAGFCLAATAKKDNLRLISVVLGSDSSNNRFDSTVSLFNYGFANYKNKIVLDKDVNLNDKFAVSCGKRDSVSVRPERNCYVFCANNENPEISYNVIADEVKAPVIKGDAVGWIEIYKNGVICDEVKLVAAEDVQKAIFPDYFIKIADNWCL